MLGLNTAGFKSVICIKHGHGMQGFRLNEVYQLFSRVQPWDKEALCCENCPDKAPHPEGWTWSFAYGKAQEERHRAMKKEAKN